MIRSATPSGCSSTFVLLVTTPGITALPVGSFTSLQTFHSCFHLQHQVDHIQEWQVGAVRTFPTAPTDVVSGSLRSDTCLSLISRRIICEKTSSSLSMRIPA